MRKEASPYIAGISPEAAELSNSFKAEILRRALKAGLLGVGTGAAAGLALTGMSSLFGRKPDPKKYQEPLEVEVPYPQKKKADLADQAVSTFAPTTPGLPAPTIGSMRWLRDGGINNASPAGIPWGIPAVVGAGAAGLVGGHQVVRWLLKKKYKSDLKRQLDDAQKEYDGAMLAQYDQSKLRPFLQKDASAESALDSIFSALEKAAVLGLPSLDQLAGTGAGLYLTGAGALGIGSAIGASRLFGSMSKERAMLDAMKRRAILRDLQHPVAVHVRPVPAKEPAKPGDKKEPKEQND